MFGNKKKEPNYAEEVEILLGEEARYESGREGPTEEICPLLSVYGSYAVCSHLVSVPETATTTSTRSGSIRQRGTERLRPSMAVF